MSCFETRTALTLGYAVQMTKALLK
jgi:hypothetical protein